MKLFKLLLSVILIASILICPVYADGNRWTNKPPVGSQIDWSHPLSKGLVGCWLMNEGGGLKVFDISGNNLHGSIIGGALWSKNKKGIGISCPTSTSNITVLKSRFFQQTKEATWIIYCFKPVFASPFFIYNEGSNTGYGIYSNPNVHFYCRIGGAWTDFNTIPLIENTPYLLVGTASPIGVYAYINGIKLAGPGENTGDLNPNTTVDLYIGNSVSNSRQLDNTIMYVMIYNRALSPQEIQQLYIDPYCFIKPQTDWNCIKAAVVAGVRRIFLIN
jgi:hypothetical protein